VKPLSDLAADWPNLVQRLDEALALPESERAAWLDRLDDTDPLKDTLRGLLRGPAGAEGGHFLNTLPKLPGLPGNSAGSAASGDTVGPWRLLRELGEGGMGSVWLARRVDGQLKRLVALKLPRLSWARGLAARMARERDILATLEHPHIARLYDAGVDDAGRPWLALEHVHGQPIDAHCRARTLPLRARVQLLLQVCDAVAYAHGRLVIHRDLKPANIFVTEDGQVRLLDFGIARLSTPEGATGEALPADTTQLAFTPGYASPEQLQGLPLGTATDIYSLGAVAHELLCGERPFARVPEQAGQRLRARLAEDPPLPSATPFNADGAAERGSTLRAWQRQIAGDLDAVLLRALARDPARRYPSVQALADDLQRWCEGRPVLARRPSAGYVLGRFVRRHRWAVAAGSTATLALAATAVVAVVLGLQAREQSQRAQAARDFMIGLFERADPDLRGGREISARDLLTQGEADAARLPPQAQQEVLQTVTRLWGLFGDNARAAQAQARLAALLERQGDGQALAAARVQQALGMVFDERWSEARQLLGLAESAQAPARWPPKLQAQAQEVHGWIALSAGQAEPAVGHFRQAERGARALGERLRALRGQAAAHTMLGQPREAAVLHDRLRTLADADPAATPRERADTLHALAGEFYMAARFAEGRRVTQQALQAAEALYGPETRQRLRLRDWWLRYALALGSPDEAAAWLRQQKITEADLRSAGQEAPLYWHLLAARVWAASGDGAAAGAAMAAAERALQALPAEVAAPRRSGLRLTQADVALALGRPADALLALAPLDDTDAVHRDGLRGVALAALARPKEAADALARVVALEPVSTQPGMLARLNLAVVLLRADAAADAARARALLAEAQPALASAYGLEAPPARAALRLQKALESAGPLASPAALSQALQRTGLLDAAVVLYR